jgi:hypothetical protein
MSGEQMVYQYEQTGTVSVTNGSRTVTGTGTNWANNYPGVMLSLRGLNYPVASIETTGSLTLVEPYQQTTATGLTYIFVPTQPENYQLNKAVQDVIEIAGELVNATIGPVGPVGPAGPAGPSGDTGVGAIVNLADYTAQPAGGSGTYLIVPVAQGVPTITLTQAVTVVLPYGNPTAGLGLWINATVSGLALTIGLTNAPLPQPPVTTEPIDLSGSSTVYGNPGTYVPLGIFLGNSTATFTLDVPGGLPIKVEEITQSIIPANGDWITGSSGSPYAVTGNGFAPTAVLNKMGEGIFGYVNGHVVLNRQAYLTTDALGLEFPSSSDEITTQTPPSLKFSWKGLLGPDGGQILAHLDAYGVGGLLFGTHWSGVLSCAVNRNGSAEYIMADESPALQYGTNQLYEVEWVNNVGGAGGTVRFWIDGVKVGTDKATESKVRISPSAALEVNATTANTNNSVDGMEMEYLHVSYGKTLNVSTYVAVADGPITRQNLERLVVDARAFASSDTEYHLTYTANGTQTYDLIIIIGEIALPAGRAYKAVLEDWSTGVGVPHARELVMTKAAAQNCKFEDVLLFGTQASWTECLPQGPVPSLDGINYYCEAIRMGNYVQFQFLYDWDEATMPSAPFGDPTNMETYMRPHKWVIYDNTGSVLERIEKPNGEPLNASSTNAAWDGTRDGRDVPMTTSSNPHYPHGTVRSSIIWRSHDPVAYSQAHVFDTVPVYDFRVPFASSTGYSVNGFDLRIGAGGAGGDGQMNGFANYRAMSWNSTTYTDITAQGAATQSPYKALFEPIAITPNAALWLKYTPWNIQGRSPVTGPGGTRDDRQIMPEMVARYARDVTATRLHDARPLKDIALNYLTGYASDAIHGMENGRSTPLFKGNPRRAITARNHYYGPGEATTPAAQAYYQQGGRIYDWVQNINPLRPRIPSAAKTIGKPYFGSFQNDADHGHQFPHWGSLLFQTPEFAFLGHKFFDQIRLYGNTIIDSYDGPGEWANRGAAWKYMHSALAWKTASANSQRLYNRAEVLDFVIYDFEQFYDRWYASDPGFLNPPTNIMVGGQINGNLAVMAGAARFGICAFNDTYGLHTHDFMVGYWLSALHAAEKMGFNDAVRAASPKAEAVLNFLVTSHQKRVIGRINDAFLMPCIDETEYLTSLWSTAQITTASGIASALPQTFAAVQAAVPTGKRSAGWDTVKFADNNNHSRDGQALDQLLAGPALLKDMGRTDAALTNAAVTAEARFQERLASETAKGELAGTEWFIYHQTTNNRPYKP